MRKRILFLLIPFAVFLTSCGIATPNKPRGTAATNSNHLTEMTTQDTTRADTYSEYVSSLRDASADDFAPTQAVNSDGIYPDTRVTEVTTVPASEGSSDGEQSAVTCGTKYSHADNTAVSANSETAVTTSFDLGEIPPVPSGDVTFETYPAVTMPPDENTMDTNRITQ